MPGIVGLISQKNEEGLFNAMLQSLNHRNYTIDSNINSGIHLGRVHLNFVNPEPQPLMSDDRRFSLVFYGEIFSIQGVDFTQPIDSARLLLTQIEKEGLKILSAINGQFCACLHDHQSRTTFLITDRFGTFPLYYSIVSARLLFATEVKSLLKDKSFSPNINSHGIAELFAFGLLFGTKTLFDNVQQVPAATILEFKNGELTAKKYWEYPYEEGTYRTVRRSKREDLALQEELGQTFLKAAKRQSSYAEEILLSLSGGIDSRYVAALYDSIGLKGLPAFTMGSDENEDQRYASQVAKVLDLKHYTFDIKPQRIWKDAGLFSYVADGMSLISGPLQNFEPLEYFSPTKKIVTYSQMCDALFGSTLSRKKVKIFRQEGVSRQATNEGLINQFKRYDDALIKKLLQPDVFRKIEGLYRIEPEKYCKNEFHPLHNYFLLFMNEYVRRGVLGGNLVINLFYQTRMISFDNDVFNFGWRLPIAYREHQYLYRQAFGKFFPELAKIKRQGYNLKIDASNLSYDLKILEKKIATVALRSPLRHVVKYYKPWNRPGYVTFDKWFRNELREDLQNFLIRQPVKSAEVVNPSYVKTLVDEHLQGKRDHSAILWQIINVEYFYRNFID